MKLDATSRLASPGKIKICAHLRELGDVMDPRSIQQLESMEHALDITTVQIQDDKLVILTVRPMAKGRMIKSKGVINSIVLGALIKALHGFIFEISPTMQNSLNIAIKI